MSSSSRTARKAGNISAATRSAAVSSLVVDAVTGGGVGDRVDAAGGGFRDAAGGGRLEAGGGRDVAEGAGLLEAGGGLLDAGGGAREVFSGSGPSSTTVTFDVLEEKDGVTLSGVEAGSSSLTDRTAGSSS